MPSPPTQSERVLEFTTYGRPIPKGSTTSFTNQMGRVVTHAANPNLPEWDTVIRIEAGDAMSGPLWEGPVEIDALFTFVRPRTSKRAQPTVKPDIDKLCRALCDAMADRVYRNDTQVVGIRAYKAYGERPGVWVRVREVES